MTTQYAKFEVSILRVEVMNAAQVEDLRHTIERAIRDSHPDRSEGNQVVVEIFEVASNAEVAQAAELSSPSEKSDRFEALLQTYDDAVAAAEDEDESVPEHHTVAKFGQVVSDARNALKRFVLR
jgi:hypothetical protein